MINSSSDILYLTLSFSVLLITLVLVLIFYYLFLVIKDFRNSLKIVHDLITEIQETVKKIKSKSETFIDSFSLISLGFKEIIKIIKNKKAKKKNKGSKK
jgi:predicted PurR-regulated permease PerM